MKSDEAERRPCPMCKELIAIDATRCPWCSTNLTPSGVGYIAGVWIALAVSGLLLALMLVLL